jgi:ribosomal protein S18 acetylase RimI-like enzyme
MSAAVAVRAARRGDAPSLVRLIDMLGYPHTEADVGHRLVALSEAGLTPLVAEREGRVIGCLTLSVMTVLHRPKPVGRISMLVVDEPCRGAGIGTLLVAAAEVRLREKGCGLVEVTSNARRTRAHAFYERLGYERTSLRFAKPL